MMKGTTAGTTPARSESTGNMALPTMWNGDTAVAVGATMNTGGVVTIAAPGRHRWMLPTFQPELDQPPSDTPAAETPGALTFAQPHLHDVFERLVSLAGLPRDWDRQGAEPIDEGAVTRAISALRFLIDQSALVGFLLPRPAVAPSPSGSIGFEWEHEANVLTIECPRLTDAFTVYCSSENTEIEQEVNSLDALWDVVRDFLRLIA